MPVPPPFPSTRWSLIRQLGEPASRQGALEQLCRDYWAPVYAFLCRRGMEREAEDLTQEFLLMALKRELFQRADPAGGRLRSWLLGSLDYFLANHRRMAGAVRRGGSQPALSLQSPEFKAEIGALAARCATPAEAFDRAWLDALLRSVIETLRRQYEQAGRDPLFACLLPWMLADHQSETQESAAAAAGLTLTNFRVQVHRLRCRYRDELRRRLAETVADETALNEELQHLISISALSV